MPVMMSHEPRYERLTTSAKGAEKVRSSVRMVASKHIYRTRAGHVRGGDGYACIQGKVVVRQGQAIRGQNHQSATKTSELAVRMRKISLRVRKESIGVEAVRVAWSRMPPMRAYLVR
jgi:hypothetical protein